MIYDKTYFKDLRKIFHKEYKALIRLIDEMDYYDKKGDDLYYGFLSDGHDGIYEVLFELEDECDNLKGVVLKVSKLNDKSVSVLYDWIKSYWELKEKEDRNIDVYIEELYEKENFQDIKCMFSQEYKILINLVNTLNYYGYKGEELYTKYVEDANDRGNSYLHNITWRQGDVCIPKLIHKLAELDNHLINLLYEWIRQYWSLKEKEGVEIDVYIRASI